jgi:hypothetical protein
MVRRKNYVSLRGSFGLGLKRFRNKRLAPTKSTGKGSCGKHVVNVEGERCDIHIRRSVLTLMDYKITRNTDPLATTTQLFFNHPAVSGPCHVFPLLQRLRQDRKYQHQQPRVQSVGSDQQTICAPTKTRLQG